MIVDTQHSPSAPCIVTAGLSSDLRHALQQQLAPVGVCGAKTVDDTVLSVSADHCALLILNHSLSGLPAMDVLARIRSNPKLASLPVIYLLDRHLDSAMGRRLLDQWGVERILVQPVDPDVVAQQAAEMLGLPTFKEQISARETPGTEPETPVVTLETGFLTLETAFLTPDTRVEESVSTSINVPRASEAMNTPAVVSEPVPVDSTRQISADQAVVLLVGDDHAMAQRIETEAITRGVRLERANDAASAERALAEEEPDLILLDLGAAAGDAGLALLQGLGDQLPGIPVLVLATGDTFLDRVQVATLGAKGYLPKTLPAAEILDAVIRQLQQTHATESRVMVVDHDPSTLAEVRSLLEPTGLHLTTLADPLRFWDVLEQASPDLLILGANMPRWSGAELCRVVRNDVRWNALPVLFLTDTVDPVAVQEVWAAGADDFVPRSMLASQMSAKVLSRLERTLLYRSMAETDPMTGVANRLKSTQTLRQFLRLAERHRESLSLALLDVDYFKQINDRYGHGTGDAVLQQLGQLLMRTFRSEDVVARWGGEEFLVGMYGMNRVDGVQRLTDLLESLHHESLTGSRGESISLTFSAGVAQFPEDGTDVQALYRAADAALYRAKESGRDRVLSVGWEEDPGESPGHSADVVVVNDDEVLGSMIVHALESRGYRTHWIKDGEAAALQLGGFDPALQAPVILLDVDLPTLDGLGVLRRLIRDRGLRDTRVIMLASRTRDADVAHALAIGAFDQVPKPFHLPVMLQRVRRAMEIL